MRPLDNRLDIDIRNAIDAQFSGLQGSPERRVRILQAAKGEKKVKKKVSLGLALALMLALITATAMAAVLTDYFGKFAQLEKTYGEYETWPASAKVELVKSMRECDLPIDGEKAERMLSAATQVEQEALAEEILDAYFAGMIYVDTSNIFVREWGDMNEWTLEQHQLYTELMKKCGWWKEDWPEHFAPSEGDLSEAQAIARAREALLAKYDVSAEELDARVVQADFFNNTPYGDFGNEPLWAVKFCEPERPRFCYTAVMRRDGEMVLISAPNARDIPWGSDTLAASRPAQRHDYDATAEKAIQGAKSDLTEVAGVSYEMADRMTASAQFLYNEHFCHGDEPVWLVIFAQDGVPRYKVLLRWDARPISWATWGKEFISDGYPTWVMQKDAYYPHGLIDEAGKSFFKWSFEEQAAFSRRMIPLVEEMLRENPYFANPEGNELYWATRQVYGVPGPEDLSQDQAAQIARQECVRLGASEEKVGERSIGYMFDVTDPQNPLWKMLIYNAKNEYTWYRVVVNARTGQVTQARLLDKNESVFSPNCW